MLGTGNTGNKLPLTGNTGNKQPLTASAYSTNLQEDKDKQITTIYA